MVLVPTILATNGTALFRSRFTISPSAIDQNATLFWVSVDSLLFLFWAKGRVNAAAVRSVEDRISKEGAATQQKTVETLAAASLTQDEVHAFYTAALERPYSDLPPVEAIHLVQTDIRVVLSSVATLVSQLEPTRMGAHFAANVMQFIELERGNVNLPPHVDACRKFEPHLDLTKQRGVLFLDRELSNCTEVESGEKDPNLEDLTLCVPRQIEVDGILQMLPGAPYAFLQREMICADAFELVELCRDGSHEVAAETATLLESYFKSDSGRSVKSIVCHPLMHTEKRLPRAVLNIHSNYEGMLDDGERRQQLYYLLRSPTLVLLKLLEILAMHKAKLGTVQSSQSMSSLPSPPRGVNTRGVSRSRNDAAETRESRPRKQQRRRKRR